MLSNICPCTKDSYGNRVNNAILASSLILLVTHTVLTILALQGHFSIDQLRMIKAITFGAIALISFATFVSTYQSSSKVMKVCLLFMGIAYGATLSGLTTAGFGNIQPVPAIITIFFVVPIASAIERDKEMKKAAAQAPLSASGAELP